MAVRFFALAIGLGEVASGFVSTIPMFLGASSSSSRRGCPGRRFPASLMDRAGVQTLSLAPLVVGAALGWMPGWLLYATVALYWASGYMTGPTWQTWFTTLVPRRIRPMFWARRSIWIQAALGLGLASAALVLQEGDRLGRPLDAFAVVFGIAMLARGISTWCLSSQSEPQPELAREIEPPTPAVLAVPRRPADPAPCSYMPPSTSASS